MPASFLLAGEGMTFGPHVLLWIGAGLFVALAVLRFALRSWTDYVGEKRNLPAAATESEA